MLRSCPGGRRSGGVSVASTLHRQSPAFNRLSSNSLCAKTVFAKYTLRLRKQKTFFTPGWEVGVKVTLGPQRPILFFANTENGVYIADISHIIKFTVGPGARDG